MTARRATGWAALLIAVCDLASVACYSEVPLDPTPRLHVASSLLGQWSCPSGEREPDAVLTVNAADDRRYAFTWQERGHEVEHYEAYASRLGSLTLFNVAAMPREDSGWPHPWAFVTASVSSDVLTIRLAGEDVVTGNERSPEEVRKALAAAAGKPGFFGEPFVCRKGSAGE